MEHKVESYRIQIHQRLLLHIIENAKCSNHILYFIWPFQKRKLLEDDSLQVNKSRKETFNHFTSIYLDQCSSIIKNISL